MKEISSRKAWHQINNTNKQSRWKSFVGRAENAIIFATSTSTQKITLGDDIFCIGSCFARNIQNKLVAKGFSVLSHQNFAPPPMSELPNIFNIKSIENELRWGLLPSSPAQPEASFVQDNQGFYYDPSSSTDKFRDTHKQVSRIRNGVTENLKRIKDCQIVILTLGLIEVWYDNKTDTYLNTTLPQFIMDKDPERYALRVLDYNDCLDSLEEVNRLLKKYGSSDVKIFLSVSPVPLVGTFSAEDVLVANTYSKSTQVAAAHDFSQNHSNVFYVPSFESVINSSREFSWQNDLRHPTNNIIDNVTDMFIEGQTALTKDTPTSTKQIKLLGDWPTIKSETTVKPGIPVFSAAFDGDENFPAGFPIVSASSNLAAEHNPNALMSPTKRIWHAQSPQRYPEYLSFSFKKMLTVKRVFIQSQDQVPARSPSNFEIMFKSGESWVQILSVDNVSWQYGGEWKEWVLDNPSTAENFKLIIHNNAGDANFLTIQNIYFSGK